MRTTIRECIPRWKAVKANEIVTVANKYLRGVDFRGCPKGDILESVCEAQRKGEYCSAKAGDAQLFIASMDILAHAEYGAAVHRTHELRAARRAILELEAG